MPNANPVTTWNGRPASRSSSFTIAERKKSYEMMTNTRAFGETNTHTHSSQDSLSRKSSRECDSAFTSRRPSSNAEFPVSNSSRRGSEILADTIKDIETRVAQMSESVLRSVNDEKWSTLEKKYGNGNPKKVSAETSPKNSANERPKELVFGPRKNSKTTPSPGSKTIRELTERWESRSSLTSESAKTPTTADTPVNSKKFDNKTAYFLPTESEEWESFDPQDVPPAPMSTPLQNSPPAPVTSTPTPSVPDRKYSVPIYSSDVTDSNQISGTVKMREGKKNNVAPSRPSSLIETGAGTELKVKSICLHRPAFYRRTFNFFEGDDYLELQCFDRFCHFLQLIHFSIILVLYRSEKLLFLLRALVVI